MIGETLSNFRVTAKLGEGGMGEVYRAQDTKLGREVAIKVLPPALAGDPERMARFEREARILAALDHPGIASIYGLEEADGRQLLVMQLVEGDRMVAVKIATRPTFWVLDREVLFSGEYYQYRWQRQYDIHPDGERFVMIESPPGGADVEIVLDWFTELNELAPPPR